MSDRLDDELQDSRLLDAHLANCERCVEHERRLVQAQDALVASFVSETQPSPSVPAPTVTEPPALKVAPEPAAAQPAPSRPAPAAPRARLSPSAFAWGFLAVMAVLLTLAAIALAVAGALGAG